MHPRIRILQHQRARSFPCEKKSGIDTVDLRTSETPMRARYAVKDSYHTVNFWYIGFVELSSGLIRDSRIPLFSSR